MKENKILQVFREAKNSQDGTPACHECNEKEYYAEIH